MANTTSESSFKVDNVDTFNTHMLQILTKEKLGILPETLKVLTACIERRYEPCSMKDPRDFMMVDGKGKLIARFSQLRGREMSLREFTSQSFSAPAQASFKECDKIVKCIKGHQQQMAHMRVPSVDYVFGGISRVCAIPLIKNRVAKQGHCFFNLLIAISYFIRAEDDAMFANIVEELDGAITYWPKLSDVSKYAQYIIAKLPYLGAMPIPAIAANHGQKLLHICDQRGVPHGWHVMKMGLLAELANAGFMKGSAIPSYYVGGTNETTVELYSSQLAKVQQRLKGWISKGNMMDDLVSDTQLAAFVILSPALLSRLQNIIEVGVSEAMNLEKLEASHENKLVAVTAVKAALVGVKVKSGVKDIEKIWLHIHSLMMGIYDGEENQYKGEMRHAVTRLYATLIAEKKYITACERALYNATEEEFSKSFGCQPTWYDKLSFTAWRERRQGYLGPAKIRLASLDDGITGIAFQFLSSLGIQLALGLVKTGCKCYTLARFLLYIFLLLWGSLSISKFMLFCLKQLIIRKFSDNYKKLVLLGAIFMVIELASYVSKKIKAQKNKEQELQLNSKENEKKMMAAMAMVTLFVHAIDMDLALVMTNSLNHVARLVNLLTDSTTGWLVGGAGRQELQMKIFDLALEVDDKMRAEEEISVATSSNQDSFAAWVNEQMTMGNDNTRPLSYGRSDSTFALNSTNATEVGQAMVETKKAWSLVVGQTGSGKSTKVPIAYYNKLQTQAGRKKNILICEPTQATTQNVAAALSHFHGKSVYYKHEGKEQHGDSSIQVMTYGSAFFKSVNNPSFLSHFDAVFLDESHLISPHSLSMEGLLNKQTEVRKFYLTATPRDHQFKVAVNRRFEIFEHPVEKADVADFIAALGGRTNLDALQYGNNVLVFLSGKSECDRAAAKVSGGVKGVKSMSLHKDNFKTNYQKIVDRLEHDEPTVIFTTNILETGVTLNVDVVVDFGYTNAPVLNFVEKTLLLRKRRVTDAERQQRIGRAGRLRDGHAIIIGKTVQTTELVSADVVYEAALLSFVYNLDVYINAHFDHSWLAGITRAQARTMLSFRMNSFFMRDLIFADGSMRPEMLQALKSSVQRSANIRTSTMQCISHVYEGWPVLGAYAPSADNMNDQLARSRVPFVTHDLFDLDIDAIAMAVKTYRTPVKSRWGKPVKEVANVIMYANQNNIHDAIRVAQSMRAEAKKQILEKERVQNMHRESPLACLFSKSTIRDLEKKLGEQIQMARRNLDKLNKFISNLEIFASSQEIDGDIDMTPDDLGEIGQCMELQMNTTCCPDHLVEALKLEELPSVSFRDAIILGRQRVATAMMILCVAAFSGLAWWYMWSDDEGLDNDFNAENKKQVYKEILEMKGKSFNRDKRMPAMQEHIAMADEYIENNPDIEHFKSKRSSGKNKSDGGAPLDRYTSQAQPFLSLYDITMDEDVVKAVFSDENKHAFYETSNPLRHMKDVEKHLNEHKAKSNLMAWGDEANDLIYCTITKNDGSIQRVRLTPHNPYRLTKHHGTQGYEEKAGQFRQSGQAEILRHPQQELEIATHLQTSNVNLDISKMIGLVTVDGGQICCIMYKDFLIMPAHVMMKKLPMKISFAHCTVTVNELPEMYSFIGYDMVLVRRPSELAPVKCQAHCGSAHDGMLVQMIYKKPVTNKAIPTITAPIHQTKEHRWAHQIPTHHGMCGCPVIDVVTGKIVGIHVMGDLARKHNVFEAFPSEALTIINTNDRKVHASFFRNKVNLWVFQPEMHGYLAKNLTNLQMMGIKSFSRDTSVYTVENFIRSARCGGLLKHRDVFPPVGGKMIEQFEHFDDLAYAYALLNTKHTYVGENPYWLEFKRNHQALVKGIEEYEDAYLPSRLTHSAYWKDLGKYNRAYKTATHDDGILLQSANCLIQMLKDAGMTETRIHSPDEVLRDVQWNKAAGPLYGMKKKELCKALTDEELISLAIHCRHELIKGENAGVWNGSLKAELRPLEKVLQDKTRVFTAAPITTLLGAKAYVDDFNKQFYKTHLHAPHTVGINKFQRGWERVYEYLNKPGWLHGSGDGSRFDASIDPFLFDVIYSIRCHFMAPEDHDEAAAAMSNMYREFVFTPVHTIAGNIIMKKLGNNSGQPSTVVDNTLVLILSFIYAYISKTGDSTCSQLHERFRFVCNGDDNKFSISREFENVYGGDFSNEIEDLGLHYEFDILTDNIMENPYMSLTMVAHNAGVGFQLNPRRIVGIVQWIKKGGVVHAAQAAFAAAIEAYNDPWLYGVMNLYLIWLLCEYRDALIFAEMNDIATVCYMDPLQVHALHYGRHDDDEFGEQELQMDPEALKTAEEERKRRERELALAAARKGKEPEKLNDLPPNPEKPKGDVPPNPEKPKGTGDVTDLSYGHDSDDEEIQWKMPAIQRHTLSRLVPTIQGRKVWNAKVLKHIPEEQFSSNSARATDEEYGAWADAIKSSLGVKTETDYQIILTAWCLLCANSGTSSEMDASQFLEVHDGNGRVGKIQAKVFISPAKLNGGLRRIMRRLSEPTSQMLARGGRMTTWGMKRGLFKKEMIPYAFDFYVATADTPKTVREQLAQAKIAAIGSGVQRAMITDGKLQRVRTSYERHTDGDNSEHEHGDFDNHDAYLE